MAFTIPEDELTFHAVRSSGPGGQHVNKASTKIGITWDVKDTASLSDEERRRVLDRLATRIDSGGVLRVTAGERRSQLQNRAAALERMTQLVRDALRVQKPRKKTKPSRTAMEGRIAAKKRRSDLKKKRESVQDDE